MLHTLAKTFVRKGALRENKSRMMITYTQVKDSGTGVYMYSVDYDGAIHYTVFTCDYYEHGDDVFALWPDERSCQTDRLINTRDFYQAQDIYWEMVKKQEELLLL